MKEFLRLISKILMRIVLLVFWFFPIDKKKVVILNSVNYKYSDSPKCIAEYLKKHCSESIDLIYVVKNKDGLCMDGIRFINFKTLEYYFNVCTSKVFVTNNGGISYIPFRKNQFVINTWHGGGAYKPIGVSLNDNLFYKFDLELTSKSTDVFLSSCEKFTDEVSQALLIEKSKFWEIGLPRNDVMIDNDGTEAYRIRKKLGVQDGTKVVLYAPTFRRNDVSVGQNLESDFEIDSKMTLRALEEKWPGKWIMAHRTHPGIKKRKVYQSENVVDWSDYPEMQDLLLVADVLITDYSSSSWDFMLTKKPIFIYAPDLEEYNRKCRLYTPVSEWPYPIATNMEELSNAIDEFDYSEYLGKCERHCCQLGIKESGKATQLLGDRITDILRQ